MKSAMAASRLCCGCDKAESHEQNSEVRPSNFLGRLCFVAKLEDSSSSKL